MKKVKMLALALSSAVMIAGAGYAAWTDKLDVNTTVDTGELSVRFVGPHVSGADYYWASPRMFYLHKDAPGADKWNWASATANDLLTGKVTYTDKVMTFKFGNLYPGTRAAGKYTMENNGTIPAVIDKVTVATNTTNSGPDGVAQVLNAMKVTHSTLKIVRDGQTIDSEYIASIPLAELEAKLNDFFRGKRLQPNDKIVLGSLDNGQDIASGVGEQSPNTFNFELPYDSLNGNDGEKEEVTIDVKFDFIQHNMFDPTP